ncbi:MAG: putative neutral zinc metalloprotease, partial [Myxococcaceae bacterium]|nr:putative neutral zinc metalloprotease [Myxococcaceae bacterium]
VCALANATAACAAGACAVAACAPTFGDCNGNPSDGCEVNGYTNPAHCGGCGRACAAGQTCQTGACVASACGAGLTSCPGGACRDLTIDPANCGACNRACGAGQVCNASSCVNATIRFSLTWNVTADLDVAVMTPSGIVINYAHQTEGTGTFIDDSFATGPETIYWSAAPPSGTYYVCAIPFRVSAATTYTLQAFQGATLSATRTGTHSTSAPSGTACSATSPYKVLDFVVP